MLRTNRKCTQNEYKDTTTKGKSERKKGQFFTPAEDFN